MRRNGLSMIAALGMGVSMMPGCIAWEIRDEMRMTNAQLAEVKTDLATINQTLEGVKSELATTNATLADVQGRLAVLEPIEASLDSLDQSLKTVKGLIEKIPFVGASEEEKPAEPAPSVQPPPPEPDGSAMSPR